MEESKAPTFSGNTLDYPEFKRSWIKIAGSRWDDDVQLEQMKLKVNPHTKRILSRCQDMTEVWQALDHKFAQEQEVFNAVDSELHKLTNLNGHPRNLLSNYVITCLVLNGLLLLLMVWNI